MLRDIYVWFNEHGVNKQLVPFKMTTVEFGCKTEKNFQNFSQDMK